MGGAVLPLGYSEKVVFLLCLNSDLRELRDAVPRASRIDDDGVVAIDQGTWVTLDKQETDGHA
jgi:hypothetical protein